jgi:chromosome partitioning protein
LSVNQHEDLNIADVLSDRSLALASVIRPTEVAGLAVAPSNLRLAAVAEGLYAKVKREERLARSMARIRQEYEWIVIDCPPALGVLTVNALAASDLTIIPCPMGARALDGLEDLLDIVHLLKGEDYPHWRILLSMVDPRKTVTQEIFAELLEPYKDKVFATKILTNEALNQAQMAKRDVFSFDARSRGATNYEALARELLKLFS